MKRLLFALTLLPASVFANDLNTFHFEKGATSVYLPCRCIPADDGVGCVTGLDGGDVDIYIKGDNEATATVFSTTADIEGGGTIGTYDTPTANTDIVMDECDIPGHYEFDLHNDYLDITDATEVIVTIEDAGAAGTMTVDLIIDQNYVTTADIQAEAEDAFDTKYILASGTCDSGSTTTCVDAERTEGDDDYWVGQVFCPTAGSANKQCQPITAFNETTDTLTFEAVTSAISTDTYEIRAGSGGFSSDDVTAIWDHVCETNGSRACGDILAWLLSEAVGRCDFNTGTNTWTCSDPNNSATRFVVVYGTDEGDRTSVTLTAP